LARRHSEEIGRDDERDLTGAVAKIELVAKLFERGK